MARPHINEAVGILLGLRADARDVIDHAAPGASMAARTLTAVDVVLQALGHDGQSYDCDVCGTWTRTVTRDGEGCWRCPRCQALLAEDAHA